MSRKGDGDKMAYEISAASPDESLLFYSNEERDKEFGCIGHLRGDFGQSGKGFWTTWWDHLSELKTQDFRDAFDVFVKDLRKQGLLKDQGSMKAYCNQHPEARIKGSWDLNVYGFRVQSEKYQFYVRCFPYQGDYNFYVYCYNNVKQRIHEKDDADKMPPSPKKKKDQPER